MKMNKWIALLLCAASSIGFTASAAERPNFIIILTDDQGYQDLGCYGSPNIRTPRIDRMAEEGLKLTSFYAQTVCGPSRASLMTGSYPMRVKRGPHDDGLMVHPAMSLNEVTLAEILKDAGYKTGMAGKWDLSGRGQLTFRPEFGPHNQGFEVTLWGQNSKCKPLYSGQKVVMKHANRPSPTELFTNKAIEFIEANKDEPFFFYLAHPMPHTPLVTTKAFKGKSNAGLYGDVIEELDYHTGRLLDKVQELGLDENTYIIFTSDNGPWWIRGKDSGHAEPLRSAKTSTYEGGLRVPFIIRAPGKVPAGTSSDLVTAMIDLFPSIAQLAGAEVPTDRVIDGIDITGIFHGQQQELNRPFFYYQHRALRAVRVGDWKLHLPHTELDKTREGEEWQSHVPPQDRAYITELTLYNLKDDIGETTNVAIQHPEVVERLLQQLDFAKRDIGTHDVIGENSRR
ncbi:sulfatase [Coraliomargarita sp. SDUM461003]|uniref:Sulfatase n=1 Tax=Thalassobacterium maritimum TaxID=3041265 RepID=A0ABU1AYQ2_9BACT|nr:sulfatase [Coraliomargarita sp. SDUM461003]MDQ8208250.1 sulfatase [Coraliomargarita sp. SDUM461003]